MVIRWQKQDNEFGIKLFGLIMLMQVIFDFIFTITSGKSSSVTLAIYIFVMLLAIIKTRAINIKDFGLLLLIYAIFGLNYLIFNENRQYFIETEMLLVYGFVLPICIFVIKNITDWNNVEKKLFPHAIVATILGALVVFAFGHVQLSYMDFSYAILPFVLIEYWYFRKHNEKKIFAIIAFAVGCVEIFTFGARGPMLFVVIFVILFELLRDDVSLNRRILIISFGIFIAVALSLIGDTIIEALSRMDAFKDSYLIWNWKRGNIFEHSTRTTIYTCCIDRIQTMGLSVSGLFGDRQYCGSVYPHNIVFEILMSYGWIFGIAFLLVLLIVIMRAYSAKNNREALVFLTMALFMRFFFSGSYLLEGKFYIYVFAVISLIKSNQRNTKLTA